MFRVNANALACGVCCVYAEHMHTDIEHAAELIAGADTLIIAAGAGMGVDSGLPDFRGNEGFWRAYPALAKAQLAFTSIASPAAFRDDARLAWGFYGHRLALYRNTVPNPGFALLQQWGARMPNGVGIFTSNVDGQFQRAGFADDSIEECHGSIHHLQCMLPCSDAIWRADDFLPEVDDLQCRLTGALPACPHCGGLARPNILMFGDGGWLAERTDAQARRLLARLRKAQRPLVVEIGAGSAIPSVRSFSHAVIQQYQGRLVRINPTEADVPTKADIGLACRGLQGLQAINTALAHEA
jgi:NAD-dependent SIR2 family protein deacetylase